MKIPESIVNGIEFSILNVEQLKTDVQFCLDKINDDQDSILLERDVPFFFQLSHEKRFRSRERSEKTSQILKFQLAFLDQFPGTVIYENKMLNPIESFRDCVLFQVNLLLEEDVRKAVFNEINQMGPLDGGNVWDFQEMIIEKNRELQELMAMAAGDDARALFAMCLVLEQFCLFWFDVKQGDLRRIRRNDIFIYKLAKVLQDRYLQEQKKEPPPTE